MSDPPGKITLAQMSAYIGDLAARLRMHDGLACGEALLAMERHDHTMLVAIGRFIDLIEANEDAVRAALIKGKRR